MNTKNSKKRLPFFRSLLPWKGDSKKLIFYKMISLAAVCVFLVCAALLINDLAIQPMLSDKEQQDIKKIYYENAPSFASSASQSSETPTSSAQPERDTQGRLVRFVNLQKVNSDIVGWIKIPNTIIDLPVLQASTNRADFYLTHDYNKNYSFYGSIYADCHAPAAGGKSRSIILYGHSLNSGRMFTQLKNYKELNFYKATPAFTFDTVDGQSQWKVISVFLTNTLSEQGEPFNYMKTIFKNDSDYLNFVYQLRIRSIYNTGVSFNANDKIVLLSTCSYEFTDFREVVVARKVRAEESDTVNTDHAEYNNKALYPDCWYKKNGGTKPLWPSTYEQAVKEKVLSWDEA